MAANWKLLEKEPRLTTALVVLCQDYVLVDEEFMSNTKIKKNMRNSEFWIELAQELRGAVAMYLSKPEEGDDDYGASMVDDKVIMNYIMDPTNRFELNDVICEAVEGWLKHFSGKRIK